MQRRRSDVLDPKRKAARPASDQVGAQRTQLEDGGAVLGFLVCQLESVRYWLAANGQDPVRRVHHDPVAIDLERSGGGRHRALGGPQDDLVAGIGPEALLPSMQPVQPYQADPPHRVAKGRFAARPDLLDAGAMVRSLVERHRLIHQLGGRKIKVGAVLIPMRT